MAAGKKQKVRQVARYFPSSTQVDPVWGAPQDYLKIDRRIYYIKHGDGGYWWRGYLKSDEDFLLSTREETQMPRSLF